MDGGVYREPFVDLLHVLSSLTDRKSNRVAVKGFYRQEIKWRIVKILEKKPGEVKEYTENMDMQIKDRIMTEQRDAILAKYSRDLLQKYTHQIYLDRIKDIDPLDIP